MIDGNSGKIGVSDEFLQRIGGSHVGEFNHRVANQVARAVHQLDGADDENQQQAVLGALAAMTGSQPQSEIEGMLMAQMVAAHECAMHCYARSQLSGQTFAGRDMNLKHAVKLSRTYAALLETLDKHRGKGKQTIKVIHQHIYAKAENVNVAGSVDRGEGCAEKSKEQPHEQGPEIKANPAALPHQPAMRCPKSFDPAVPRSGDAGKKAVQASWGQGNRRAKGQ